MLNRIIKCPCRPNFDNISKGRNTYGFTQYIVFLCQCASVFRYMGVITFDFIVVRMFTLLKKILLVSLRSNRTRCINIIKEKFYKE